MKPSRKFHINCYKSREYVHILIVDKGTQQKPIKTTDGTDLGISKNRGTPKSSILIGFSIINPPFWGTPIFGNIHLHITSRPSSWGRSPSESPPKWRGSSSQIPMGFTKFKRLILASDPDFLYIRKYGNKGNYLIIEEMIILQVPIFAWICCLSLYSAYVLVV